MDSLFVITKELFTEEDTKDLNLEEVKTVMNTLNSLYDLLGQMQSEMTEKDYADLVEFRNNVIATFDINRLLDKQVAKQSTFEFQSNLMDQFNIALNNDPSLTIEKFGENNGYRYEDGVFKITSELAEKLAELENKISNFKKTAAYTNYPKFKEVFKGITENIKSARKLTGGKNTITPDSPVAYTKNNEGIYVFDDLFIGDINNRLAEIESLLVTIEDSDIEFLSYQLQKEYNRLKTLNKKAMKNKISETMLELITNPDMAKRILAPITFTPLENALDSIDSKLILSEDLDLSNPRDKFKSYRSLKDGAILTGAFAKAVKVFAYMSRAGIEQGELAELYNQLDEATKGALTPQTEAYPLSKSEYIIKINDIKKQIKEVSSKSVNKEKRAFVNPRYHFSIKSGAKTTTYNALATIDSNNQYTVTEIFDSLLNAAIDNLKLQLLPKLKINTLTGSAVVGMVSMGVPIDTIVKILYNPAILPLSDGNIDNVSKFFKAMDEKYGEDKRSVLDLDNMDEASVYYLFKKAHKVGEDMRNLSSFLGVVQRLDVFIEQLDKSEADLVNNIGTINDDYKLSVRSDFSLVIPNLLVNNPHILEAYKSKQRVIQFINSKFKAHSPEVRSFVTNALKGYNASLENNAEVDSQSKNLVKARATVVRMIYSSMVSDIIENTPQKKVKVEDGEILLSKAQSFSDNVMADLRLIKDYYSKNKTFKNHFLELISIYKTKSGTWKIKLNTGVNLNSMDIQEVARGFRMLNKYFINNGAVSELPVNIHSISQFQKNLLNYAVLNFGLKFSSSSFANLVQGQIIKELDSKFDTMLNSFLSFGKSAEQFFMLSYMMSNSERMAYVDFKNIEYATEERGEKKIKLYHGTDTVEGSKVYYDRKVKRADKTVNPAFISNGYKDSTTIFIKVLETDTHSYYQEVGKVKDVIFSKLTDANYTIPKYFSADEFTLGYAVRNGNEIIASRRANDLLNIGDVFYITPSYSYDRQDRVKVKLVSKTKISDKKIGKNLVGMYKYVIEEVVEETINPPIVLPTVNPPNVSYSVQYFGSELDANRNTVKSATDKMSYDVNGNKLDTVTTSLIPSMKRRQFAVDGKTLGQRKGDKLWEGLNKEVDTKLTSYGRVTYQQYVDLVDEALEKGTAKGTIFHSIIHAAFHPQTLPNVVASMEANGFTQGQFDWVYENVNQIISKTGTDYIKKRYTDNGIEYIVNPQSIDKIYTEVPVYSLELGAAGTIDMLIDHSQDIYSLFDLKTGNRFTELFEYDMFKYGSTATEDVFDTPRNRAKLQLMWYALMLKIQRPDAKFKNIEVLHIPNKYALNDVDFRRGINYAAYLEMIENYLKNEKPEQYEKLKQLPQFKSLFSVDTYGVVTKEVLDKGDMMPSMDLNLKMLRLQSLIMYRKNFLTSTNDGNLDGDKQFKEIRSLMQDIIKLKKTPGMNFASEDNNDMSWMERYLGSQSSTTNPYIQLYYKELSSAKAEAESKIKNWEKEYASKMKALIADYRSKNNMGVIEMIGTITNNWIGGIDKNKLFEPLYKLDTRAGEFKSMRLLTSKDSEWEALTNAQKSYLTFVNKTIASYFKDELSDYVDPRTGKKVALANRVVTERELNGKTVQITNLGLFNGEGSFRKSKDNQFEYYEGFFPKVAQTVDDIKQKHGAFSKEMLQFLKLKHTTNYFESVYEGIHNIDEAFPMKYLDNREIILNDNFSLDLDLAVNQFVKQYTYKQELDDVYVFANGLKLYLDAKDQVGNNINLDKLVGWFEDSINLHILGKRQTDLPLRKREFRINTTSGFKKFNWAKFFRSLKAFFGASTMWLKPVSGLANFAFASIATIKAGIRNDISNAWYGVSDDPNKFGTTDILKGLGMAFNMYLVNPLKRVAGEDEALKNDKLFILMDKLRYFNDSYDWYVEQNRLITSKNKLFTSKSMYAFHTLPEEIISAAVFYAQMNALKLEDGSSIYDHYVKTEKIIDGEVVIDYEWDGTIRGKRTVTNVEGVTELRDVKGLEIEEINAIKYVYERIHGGYKTDERVAAEYYVFGELMLQLKKYMPAILRNQFASKGIRMTEGSFKKDDNGNLVWTPQVIEGRMITLVNVLYTMIGLRAGKSKSPWLAKLGLNASESYEWNKLSREQKDNITDAMVTMFFFALMMFGYTQMWDQDDEDGYKKLYARIMNDFSGEWNLVELIRNTGNIVDPVVRKKATKLMESSAQLTTSLIYNAAGIDDEGLTKQGNIRGLNEFMRGIPLLSSIHDLNRFLKESYDDELYDFRLK